ncbi:MAG: 2-C-methyl-D-erythritol 4-phosphate cytidylyltransferase [Balneolaceae bacterium]
MPAAGSGKRLGENTPKPYLEIAGKTILEHTLLCFAQIEGIEEIVVPASDEYKDLTYEILKRVFPGRKVQVVPGGKERQDSISNALGQISPEIHLVAVHDAVRPFVNRRTIEDCFEKAAETGAAIVAVPAKDTIKKAGADGIIYNTPDRNNIWQAQTPQVFERELLMKAYQLARENRFTGTDDSSLVEKAGGQVTLVEGTRENFKITWPLDFQLAELLLNKKI